jgi:hypothetical protein
MATFLQAPLRFRTVGFPESGSDLGSTTHLAFPMPETLKCSVHIHATIHRFAKRARSYPVLESQDEVSSPGEFRPEALSEPYLNLSAHTAPAMEPCRTPICQCAHNFGSRREIRATQCVALRK